MTIRDEWRQLIPSRKKLVIPDQWAVTHCPLSMMGYCLLLLKKGVLHE